ncbi:Tn3 family transposase [Streptomyces sp. NPDC058663]
MSAPPPSTLTATGRFVRSRTSTLQLRYVRRRYLSVEAARAIAVQTAHATFAARSTELWDQGSPAVASDSTHVRCYDQSLPREATCGHRGATGWRRMVFIFSGALLRGSLR